MKKNLPIYILLFFLIIMNSFFLYNYLGNEEKGGKKTSERPGYFIVEELGFNDMQQEQFSELAKRHHHRMQALSEDIRGLKDELFKGLSDAALRDVNIDSIAGLIGEKETAKDLEVFYHFKQVQEMCNSKQKEKFSEIIKAALQRGSRGQGPPSRSRLDGNGPPRAPNGPHGDRPPPLGH